MSEIKTIRQANDRLAELGHKRQTFSNLKLAQAAVAKAEKAGKVAKPTIAAIKSAVTKVATIAAVSPIREGLLKAIEAATTPGAKADLYQKLSSSLLEEANKTTDLTKKTELLREFQRSEKNRAYSLLAERQLNPAAAKARKAMRLVD
jgi:hypothetical protein